MYYIFTVISRVEICPSVFPDLYNCNCVIINVYNIRTLYAKDNIAK